MPSRRVLLTVAGGWIILAGCAGDYRDRTPPGAERAEPGVQSEKLTPEDLRTGEGDVGATGRRSERPAGVMGEQGPVEAGGAGTATETGEIVGRSETPKKQNRDAKR